MFGIAKVFRDILKEYFKIFQSIPVIREIQWFIIKILDIIIKVEEFIQNFVHFILQLIIVIGLVIWEIIQILTFKNTWYYCKLIFLKICMLLKLVLELNVSAFFPVFCIFIIISFVYSFLKNGFFHLGFFIKSVLKLFGAILLTIMYRIIKSKIDNASILSLFITILLWITNSVCLVINGIFMVKKAIILSFLLLLTFVIDFLFHSDTFSIMRNILYPFFLSCENSKLKWEIMNDLHRKNVYERSGLLRMCYSPCKEGYIPSITSESCKKGPDNIPSYCPVQMIKNIENTGKLDIGRKSYNDLKMLINKKYEVFDIEKYVNDMNKYMNECEFTFKNYDFIGKSVCENGDTSKELSDLCKLQYCNTGNNVDCISCLKYDNPIQSDIEKKINDVYDNMKTNNILIITFSIIVLLIIYVKAIQSIQN